MFVFYCNKLLIHENMPTNILQPVTYNYFELTTIVYAKAFQSKV